MTQARIRAAFEAPLATWAAAQTPALPVAWENVTFSPGTRYVRANLLPAEMVSLDLLGKHRQYKGIFQVTLILPQGTGMGVAESLVASLDAAFPQHDKLTVSGLDVFIVRPVSAARPLTSAESIDVPVSIRYEANTVTT